MRYMNRHISMPSIYIWDCEAFRNAEWGMSKLMLLRSRAEYTCSHHVHSMNATEHSSASACWCRKMIFCIGRVHMIRACVFGTGLWNCACWCKFQHFAFWCIVRLHALFGNTDMWLSPQWLVRWLRLISEKCGIEICLCDACLVMHRKYDLCF